MNAIITKKTDGRQHFISNQPFLFVLGGKIAQLELTFETFGTLNANQDNAILVHHALSTNSHVTSSAENRSVGWWENIVGPGKAIDTNRYFVICINNLGSCFGSSGPASVDPTTQALYRMSFPALTIEDMVRAQHLLLNHLGIDHLFAVISASMGAMLSLTWAVLYPQSTKYLISISSCYRSHPTSLAFRHICREIIKLDPAWANGNYTQQTLPGFILARKLGHLNYRNAEEFNPRFLQQNKGADDKKGILSYLQHNAEKFTKAFDANSYLYLTAAMDSFNILQGVSDPQALFAKISAKTLVLSVSSDTLFYPAQQQELFEHLQNAGIKATYIMHQSIYGHDAFLIETNPFSRYITNHLCS